ncbi:hypothetical protein BJY52DRAFT_1274530 [Lactarius psammicola]|nr:hypothetical protein BJY52DRAFT_1274530 [Lactarius psammicola]
MFQEGSRISVAEPQRPYHVLRRFQTIPPNPRESGFYAPHNKLLHTLFSADSGLTVHFRTGEIRWIY